MKRFFNLLFALLLFTNIANAITVDDFVAYCSNMKDVNVIKSTRFNLDKALDMEIETGNMLIIRDAPSNVIKEVKRKINEINDSHFSPVVQQKDNANIIRIYLEQNGNNPKKKLVVVTIEDKDITIVNVKGKLNIAHY